MLPLFSFMCWGGGVYAPSEPVLKFRGPCLSRGPGRSPPAPGRAGPGGGALVGHAYEGPTQDARGARPAHRTVPLCRHGAHHHDIHG
jgi:hypothetical protein